MSNRPDRRNRADHLRSGIGFLVAWIGVLIVEIRVFEDGGLAGNLSKFRDGDFFPLLLVSASVILLALALRSLILYFK